MPEQQLQQAPQAPRRKTGSFPAVAPSPAPEPIDVAALAAEVARLLPATPAQSEATKLLSASLAAIPPGFARWIIAIGIVAATLYGAQLRALWGLPDRVAAVEASLERVEAKIDALSAARVTP